MALNKQILTFDVADLDNSDQVGAHILGTSDNKVTSTTDGAKELLDVNVVLQSGVFDEDTAHTDGDKGAHVLAVRQDTLASSVDTDGDYGSLKLNALGELYSIDTGANTKLAAIQAQTDQFTFDAGRLEVLADIDLESDVADDEADTENPLKVGTRAVDGLLAAISASGDKANMVSDMYRRLYVVDAPNVGGSYAAEAITDTAAQIAATPLAGRTRILVQNTGNNPAYLAFDGSVTSSTGLVIEKGGYLELPFGEDLSLHAVCGTGDSTTLRVFQIG